MLQDAVRPGLEPGTPRLQGECSTDRAIWLPDTLSPLERLSPNRDIKIYINEILFAILKNIYKELSINNEITSYYP